MKRKPKPAPSPGAGMPPHFDTEYIPPDVGSGFDWRCQRCGHNWRSNKPNSPKPRGCANCRSAYWDKQPKTRKAIDLVRGKQYGRATRAMAEMPRDNAQVIGLGRPVSFGMTEVNAVFGGVPISSILPPPPHMQRALYQRPNAEPAPENLIRKSVTEEKILSEKILSEKLDDNLGTDQGSTETETLPTETTNVPSPPTSTEEAT